MQATFARSPSSIQLIKVKEPCHHLHLATKIVTDATNMRFYFTQQRLFMAHVASKVSPILVRSKWVQNCCPKVVTHVKSYRSIEEGNL